MTGASDSISRPAPYPSIASTGPVASGSMHVVCVAAARPNFMKIKPVVDGLEAAGATTSIVHTGQHYDSSMSDVFFEDLGIRTPDHHLGAGSGSHAEQTAKVLVGFENLLGEIECDAVVVVGDVNSTLACALVGAKGGLLVAHVEAGLRSRDWGMPEEVNRVVADRVSDLLLAPSPDAVENLEREGYRADQIHLVGNVMIDTLLANRERAKARAPWQGFDLAPGEYGLVTLHRPANVDDPEILGGLITTLSEIAERTPLLFPVHPRTRQTLSDLIDPASRIVLCEPLGYLDFLGLMSQATVMLTDSGGIQEETTVLGVPCITLRENTERPITVTEGTNQVVGRDRAAILSALDRVEAGEIAARRPALWDGRAGERIAHVLLDAHRTPPPRPTDL